MKNIVLEELNRVKLLMNYDSKTTLSENIERIKLTESKEILSEQTGKAFLKAIFGTQDDIAKAIKYGSKNAKYAAGVKLFDDVAIYGNTGLKSGDDVMKKLLAGQLTKSQLSELAKGLMKSGKATGSLRTTLTNKAADLAVKDARYASMNQKQIKNALVNKGYEAGVADEIASKVMNKRATTIPKGKGTGKGTGKNTGKSTSTKPKRKPKSKPQPQPNKPSNWEVFRDRLKGMSRSQVLKYLLAAGGIYLVWQWLTSEGSTPYPPCLTSNLGEEDVKRMSDSGLGEIVIVNTGDVTIDSNGGGKFYDDGKFETGNGRYSGSWVEEGGAIVMTIEGRNYTMACGGEDDTDDTEEGGEGGTGGGSKYTQCDSFPIKKGCKGGKVVDIQECIGAKPDGYFGPKTESMLTEKGYPTEVTQEVYDKIMKNCGKSATDDTKPELNPDVTSTFDI